MGPSAPEIQLIAMCTVLVVIVAMYLTVRWVRRHSHDTRLWGTIFESLTHYVQPQGALKEPKQEIRKQKRQSGDDKDKNEAREP